VWFELLLRKFCQVALNASGRNSGHLVIQFYTGEFSGVDEFYACLIPPQVKTVYDSVWIAIPALWNQSGS